METLLDSEHPWIIPLIERMELLALELKEIGHPFQFIRNQLGRSEDSFRRKCMSLLLEFVAHSDQFENTDRSIEINTNGKFNGTFFILSNLKSNALLNHSSTKLNSDIIHLNIPENLPVTFRHLVSEKLLNNSKKISFD